MVSLVATDERLLAARDLTPAIVRGVISLDAVAFDLPRLVPLLVDRRDLYLSAFGRTRAQWRDASPSHHVEIGPTPPPFLLLIAGEGDATHLHGGAFARRLAYAGAQVETRVFGDETHGTINSRLGDEGHGPTHAVEEFLGRLLGSHDPPTD